MSFFSIYREWITGIKCDHLTLLVNVTNSLGKLRPKKITAERRVKRKLLINWKISSKKESQISCLVVLPRATRALTYSLLYYSTTNILWYYLLMHVYISYESFLIKLRKIKVVVPSSQNNKIKHFGMPKSY